MHYLSTKLDNHFAFKERGCALGAVPKRVKSVPDSSALKGMLNDLDDAMADIMGMVKDTHIYPRSDSHSSNPITSDDDSSSSEEEAEGYFSSYERRPPPSPISIQSKKSVDRFVRA